jgi:hypothetical protein
LRLKLTYWVDGPEAVVTLGPEAIAAVLPGKVRYGLYQIYSAALNHLGRDEDAIVALLEGALPETGQNRARLLEVALALAACMPGQRHFEQVRSWSNDQGDLRQAALADVLFYERAGDWRGGAERARIARRQHGTYLHLALHEAFCWLAADDPDEAQQALDHFPRTIRFGLRESSTWLGSFVALRTGDFARGHSLAEAYLGGPLPRDATAIERALVREWDTRVATLGEPNPALEFPILPPILAGLPHPVMRPQHGPPVLPQHAPGAQEAAAAPEAEMRILAVGTEWASGHGGLSTFNRQLCIALARTGADVTCLAIAPTAVQIE